MNKLKKFKVFYFLGGDHQGIDETRRKWELIMAKDEDEAEKLFKLAYSKDLSDYFDAFDECMFYKNYQLIFD